MIRRECHPIHLIYGAQNVRVSLLQKSYIPLDVFHMDYVYHSALWGWFVVAV